MIQEITGFLKSLDSTSLDPIRFLSEQGIRVNVNQIYLQKKIISQLSVRDHIEFMGPALKTTKSRSILTQITTGETPTLFNRLIDFMNSGERITYILDDKMNVIDPMGQANTDNSDNNRLPQVISEKKKRSIRDIFRSKKEVPYDPTIQKRSVFLVTKLEKMAQYHFMIPEEVQKREKQLAELKWYDFRKKAKLTNEIRLLQNRRQQYENDIMRYTPESEDETYTEYKDGKAKPIKAEDVQEWWENFYNSHSGDMLEFVGKRMKEMREGLTPYEKLEAYEQCIEEYLQSVSFIEQRTSALEKDILGHIALSKFVFCQDHKGQSLSEVLQGIRGTIDEKLVPSGQRGYRKDDILPANEFMKKTAKHGDIPTKMGELEQDYSLLGSIEDTDTYIERSVDIFTRLLQIHPYLEGNGRTSRALLDIMLVNRGIVPPVLYDTYYDRGVLDEKVTKYLAGEKGPLYDFVKQGIQSTPENITQVHSRNQAKLDNTAR